MLDYLILAENRNNFLRVLGYVQFYKESFNVNI